MSEYDAQWWALMIGLGAFASLVTALLLRRRLGKRAPKAEPQGGRPPEPSRSSAGASATAVESATRRRRPAPPPPAGTPAELAAVVRSAILRAVGERTPRGWSALVLAPPPHPVRMTWHVHLAPGVALDLRDGRTIVVAAPEPTHEWQAGARTVRVGDGDPDPAPGPETAAVRVTGPYLTVTLERRADGSSLLTAGVVVASGDPLPCPQAPAADARAVQAALREAVELAIGTRMSGTAPAAGYPLAAWHGHERTWLAVAS